MRILSVDIKNFRGIADGYVEFSPHALLVGPNNVGKSTVLEALNLALGPDRSLGPNAISEHDFHDGCYAPGEAEVPPLEPQAPPQTETRILITVTLGDLRESELTRFRAHIEAWNTSEARPYNPLELETLRPTASQLALRVRFEGWYDANEDEFHSRTIYIHPQHASDDDFDVVGKRDKQAIGFLYLRAMRTGQRALSLQRGSLLDVLFRTTETRPHIWQTLIDELRKVGDVAAGNEGIRKILDALETKVGEYVPRSEKMSRSRLNVTHLTREHLRESLCYFPANPESDYLLPFGKLGGGLTNILVLSLLALIAKRKENVIFAMEEPEIGLGPTIQRRIVSSLKADATQAILTSHSPYVAEQMLPDQIVVLRRDGEGKLESAIARPTDALKKKILRQDFRLKFAEGILGSAVIVVEGVTETFALPIASNVLASLPETKYQSLDLGTIIPVRAESDGELAKVASYFHVAGIATYVFCDKLNDDAMRENIKTKSLCLTEHPYKDFEDILEGELSSEVLRRQLRALAEREDYPVEITMPDDSASDVAWKQAFHKVLSKRKAEGYAGLVLESCTPHELPKTIVRYLRDLHEWVTGIKLSDADPVSELLS